MRQELSKLQTMLGWTIGSIFKKQPLLRTAELSVQRSACKTSLGLSRDSFRGALERQLPIFRGFSLPPTSIKPVLQECNPAENIKRGQMNPQPIKCLPSNSPNGEHNSVCRCECWQCTVQNTHWIQRGYQRCHVGTKAVRAPSLWSTKNREIQTQNKAINCPAHFQPLIPQEPIP